MAGSHGPRIGEDFPEMQRSDAGAARELRGIDGGREHVVEQQHLAGGAQVQ